MTHAQVSGPVDARAPWLTRAYDPGAHPHAPAGTAIGGQFVAAGAAKAAAGAQKKPAGKSGSPTGRKPAMKPSGGGSLAYNPKTDHGPGFGTKNGDRRVHQLQQALNRLGITDSSGKALKDDGKLGPKTSSAVKKAQKRLGLKPDGVVTPALLRKLVGLKTMPRRSSMLDLCVRSFDFELESRGGDGRTLEGYAAVFNVPARIRDFGGDFDETILPGAFKRSLAERMPILQWDHGKDPRVGTVPIGAIQDLAEDTRGLHVKARLFDNPVVEPVRQAIEGRAVRGMSFRFGVPEGGDEWPARDKRHVRDADVHELGPVAFPAYDATSVSVRSLLAQCDPDERRALIRELAAELRLAVDLNDLTGQSDAWSDDGGESGAEPDLPQPMSLRQRLDDDALRLKGILR
jgi:HK97 family phage prohead protease